MLLTFEELRSVMERAPDPNLQATPHPRIVILERVLPSVPSANEPTVEVHRAVMLHKVRRRDAGHREYVWALDVTP